MSLEQDLSGLSKRELRQLLESYRGREISADDMEKAEKIAKTENIESLLQKGADHAGILNVSRRDFLKAAGVTSLAFILSRCASTGGIIPPKETGPVHYPKLPGHKIQSPEHYGFLEGCKKGGDALKKLT